MQRLGALQISLRSTNRILAAPDRCFGALKLRVQLRDFENRKRLSRLYVISDIDINLANVACDLGVYIYFLKGAEFSGQSNHVGDRTLPCQRHCDRSKRSLAFFRVCTLAREAQDQNHPDCECSNKN